MNRMFRIAIGGVLLTGLLMAGALPAGATPTYPTAFTGSYIEVLDPALGVNVGDPISLTASYDPYAVDPFAANNFVELDAFTLDLGGNLGSFDEGDDPFAEILFNFGDFAGFNIFVAAAYIDPFTDDEYDFDMSLYTPNFDVVNFYTDDIAASGSLAPVPEPGTMLLLGSGLVGLAGYGRKRRKE